MIKRETELQHYLSKREERLRDYEVNIKIEASLEELLDKNSPNKGLVSDEEVEENSIF